MSSYYMLNPSVNQNRLTWALVIATYQRAHILPRCLRLAVQQTRLPTEIIVVDFEPELGGNARCNSG